MAATIRTSWIDRGLNIISSFDLNDMRDERQKLARRLLTLQMLDSAVSFSRCRARRLPVPRLLPSGRNGRPWQRAGTVSSTLIALGKKPRDAIFQYANGSPETARYEDYSPLLRDILSRGLRESRTKAKA